MAQRIEVTDLPETDNPAAIKTAVIEIQQPELEEGEQSQSVEIQKIVDESAAQITPIIEEKIVPVNARIDALDAGVDARISAIDHLAALDVPALLAEIKPVIETWSSGGSKVNVLRDNQDITLPDSPEIGDNVNILVQATPPGRINQLAGTTLRNAEHYNATGEDGFLRLRNNQRLEVTYVADELVEDRGYADLGDITDIPPTGSITAIAVSANGNYVAVGHKNAPFLSVYRVDGRVLRKVGDGEIADELTGPPMALAFDSTRNWIHIGTSIGTYHLIYGIGKNAEGEPELFNRYYNQQRAGEPDYSVDVSPDGVYIAEGHAGGTVTIKLSSTWEEVAHPYTSAGALDVVHSVAWSPRPPEGTDQLLAIGHYGSPCITFLALRDGAFVQLDPVRTIRHRSQAIKDLAWSSDGELLAAVVGSEVIVYNMIGDDRNVVKEITHKYPGGEFLTVAFSSRKHLAISSGSSDGMQPGQVDFYDFSNNEAPGDNERLLTLSGLFGITAALWTVGDGYFLIGRSHVPYMDARHATEYLQGVWFVSRLDGPKIQASDFSSIASPAETPAEEPKPAKKKRRKKEGK